MLMVWMGGGRVHIGACGLKLRRLARRSHPNGSSELEVGLTATSGNFLSIPSRKLFAPGPREPTNFPSPASPTACSAWGVDFTEEFRGTMGMLGSIVKGGSDRLRRCQRQLNSEQYPWQAPRWVGCLLRSTCPSIPPRLPRYVLFLEHYVVDERKHWRKREFRWNSHEAHDLARVACPTSVGRRDWSQSPGKGGIIPVRLRNGREGSQGVLRGVGLDDILKSL